MLYFLFVNFYVVLNFFYFLLFYLSFQVFLFEQTMKSTTHRLQGKRARSLRLVDAITRIAARSTQAAKSRCICTFKEARKNLSTTPSSEFKKCLALHRLQPPHQRPRSHSYQRPHQHHILLRLGRCLHLVTFIYFFLLMWLLFSKRRNQVFSFVDSNPYPISTGSSTSVNTTNLCDERFFLYRTFFLVGQLKSPG